MQRHKKGCGLTCSKPEKEEKKQYEAPMAKKKRGAHHETNLPSSDAPGPQVFQQDFVGRDVLIYHPKSDTQQIVKFPRGQKPPAHMHVLWDEDVHSRAELNRILARRKEIKHQGFGLPARKPTPPHLVKGSKAAKAHMAKLRAMRKTQ